MSFRITPQHFVNNAVRYSQQHTSKLETLQRQISTGLRVEKPSDDPTSISTLLANKSIVSRIEVDLLNVEAVRSKLNQSVSQLISAKTLFTRAQAIALEGIQSLDPETLANEVDGLFETLLQVANVSDGGKPLYGGTSTNPEPFIVAQTDSFGKPSEVTYRGTTDRSTVAVGSQVRFDAIFSGAETFQSSDRQPTIFVGNTGAQAGSGTDSGIGSGQLIVRHTATTFAGGSGLVAGTDSATGDTIIGQHTLTIDSANGTISLDGGPTVSLSPPNANLQITGKHGDIVYVDTTALNPAFNGDVSITAAGTLSVDGGLTETAIDFSDNQLVIDSRNDRVTNVRSSDILRKGVEELEYAGTSDAFRVLVDLRNELLNTRGLSKPAWVEAMNRRLGDIERVHDHFLRVVSEQAVSLENLDTIQTRSEDYELETQRAISDVESADLIEVVSRLQAEQNQLQFVYATSARLLSVSLLDFLQ